MIASQSILIIDIFRKGLKNGCLRSFLFLVKLWAHTKWWHVVLAELNLRAFKLQYLLLSFGSNVVPMLHMPIKTLFQFKLFAIAAKVAHVHLRFNLVTQNTILIIMWIQFVGFTKLKVKHGDLGIFTMHHMI